MQGEAIHSSQMLQLVMLDLWDLQLTTTCLFPEQ